MAERRSYMGRVTLGILLFTAQIHSQKILSDRKKCGDPQCESLMMRVSATQDYSGPDCRFLTFKTGHEINVYYKLSGRREDLWQGSTGKAYGFFPKHTVTIEEVYLREEIEMPAKEIDFVCLDGGEYFFENEDSVLRDNDADREDPADRTLPGGGHLTEESPEPEAPVKESWAPSGIAGWFGMGKTNENKDTDADAKTESLETKNEEAEPQKPLDEAPAETPGWLGGRLKTFLPFGGQGHEPQAKDDEEYRERASTPTQQTDQEQRNTVEDGEEPKSKWFNFGLRNVLGFGAKNEKKEEELRPSEEEPDKVGTPEPDKVETPEPDKVETPEPDKVETPESQDKAMDGNLIPDPLDIPRRDQDKTKGVEIDPEIQVEDTVVTKAPEKEDGSSQCDAEGGCTVTTSPGHLWERPQGAKENLGASAPIQLYAWSQAFTVTLKKMISGYGEVRSRYLVPVRSQVTRTISKVVSLLPDDLQPSTDFYGCSWDVVIFTALFGFLSVLMFTCRTVRCIKSRFYASREYKLGNEVAEAVSSKREVLEKLSIIQKQYEDVQQTLQLSGHQTLLTEISEQKALQESLQASNKELEENIAKLEQDLEEEKQRGSELDSTLAELNEKIKALEESFKKETSQKEETRTTQKVFEINKGRLESSLQDAVEEKSHLEESIKQLSEEAEGWEERFSELSENSRILSSSVGVMEEDLGSKQIQIKSLIDNLLSLKDWSSELDEVNDDDDNDVLSSIKWEFENGEPLGDPQKQRIKKLIYAAMLNASLKSVESEKKHLCDNLSDEMKAKEQLAECITNLQNTSQSLSHEKGQLEEEVENLKQKMSVMMEMYQENERKLHRKLTVQEKERIQKEAKLSKADEKMNMATSELVTVRTRVSELEEEMDRTAASYQNQVTSYEKKSHDNWLTARAAERYLSDVKKETGHLRQKLTEAEYKLELVEKDPFALDVIQAIGRENSSFGLSPINRHPESRAFLSPPTLLEGPLRLSPMLPTGDRGVRPPGYYPGYPGPKERGDVNSERRADHQRSLSDAGSLSPPWDKEQRNNVPPPGLPYPEPPFAPRRAERFYHYPPPSGRFSGPAELTRNQGRPFMDSQDGRSSPEYKARMNASRNGEEDANNISAASSQDNEVMDGPPGEFPMHPPPPMRVPLLPRDPRAPYFRRPLMPPPPMEMYGPPGYPGMPPPFIPMRSPVPPLHQHHYPPYPMHGDPYFPPQPIRPPTRNDPSSDSTPPPTSSGGSLLPPQDKLPEPTT